jgi:alpha-tubulin suppressor-like RCC1 family protein
MNTQQSNSASKAGIIITNNLVLITLVCLLAWLSASLASAQIATGTNHTLAIQTGGNVYAWGYNYYGQLGNNTTTEETSAVEVQTASGALANVVDVAAGANHSVALDSSGTVWAWGYNSSGQLGTGNTTNSSVAVKVQTSGGPLANIIAIAAGDNSTLALRNDGTVWAVGSNSNGQLGNGTTTQETTAVEVETASSTYLTNIVAIAAGTSHSMALDSNGYVWTWGANSSGQLGLGTTTQETYAQQVTAISGIGQIAAGSSHSLAMTINGSVVYSWGYNASGQLGNNTNTQEDSPVTMIGISNAKTVAAGTSHSVVLENDGTVWTVGDNTFGELGIGSTVVQHEAVQVPSVGGILAIAARGNRTLMYTNVGTILGVGDDFYGGLGDGKVGYQLSPYSVTGLTGVTQVSSGNDGYHSLAVTSSGAIYAAGSNGDGQLGLNNQVNSNTFVQVQTSSGYLTGITASAAGGYHSLALTSGGNVYGWGDEGYGEVGNGINQSYTLLPAEVVTSSGALANITAISAGENHSLALRNDGTVWAWGSNSEGQLGNNTTTNSNKAIEVLNTSGTALSNIVAIAAGENHSLAVDSSGNLWAWGYNANGQLGDGTTTNHLEAEEINLSGQTVTAVSGGGFYSLAITSTGTALAWGANSYGELGDGTTTNRLTPVAVQNISGVTAIYAGQYHSMAVESNGSVWVWGYNGNGELGNGTFDLSNHTSPTQMSGITAASGANPGSCGGYHNLLVNSSGTFTTWANGMYGQLGDAQFGYASSPVTAVFSITQDTSGLWVDTVHGSDSNTGTYSAPFQTIMKTIQTAYASGNTANRITIRAGTYHEVLYLNINGVYPYYSKGRSGTSTTPFVIRGMPGERVIISGMKPITGWSLSSGSIYQSNIGTWATGSTPPNTSPDTFYMGMNERLMAQLPAPGTAPWVFQSATTSGTNMVITDTAHLTGIGTLSASSYIQLGYAGNSYGGVGTQGAVIISNNPTAGTVTIQGNYNLAPASGAYLCGMYIIKNSLQCLTQPGEWACIPSSSGGAPYTMYYWPENSTEISQLTSSNPPSQARDTYSTGLPSTSANDMIPMVGLSYVNIEGLEIMGASGKGCGIDMNTCTDCNATWNVIHDNGGYGWNTASPPVVYGIYGDAISMTGCTSCTAANNVMTLNFNGAYMQSDTTCTFAQNDIGWNYIDGIDMSSENNSAKPCLNCTITQNYIHHQFNLLQHPDAIQTYDAYVQTPTISNNVMLAQIQMELNGMGGGTFQNNVMWHLDMQNFAGKDNQDSSSNPQQCNYFNNTTQQWVAPAGDYPLSVEQNVINGRLEGHATNYTGDYNYITPLPYTPNPSPTYDAAQMVIIPTSGGWPAWGYKTASPYAAADFSAWFLTNTGTAQDTHSYVTPTNPTPPLFTNMPTTFRAVNYISGLQYFTTNTTSTTVALAQTSTTGGGTSDPLGDIVVGDYIEWDMDGVPRQVTATNATNGTITFTPAVWGVTEGDGLGYCTLPTNDFIENWGTSQNFARNTKLVSTSWAATASPTGGAIGSSLNIGQYQVDDFLSSGISCVPAIPPDVLANQAAHKWHFASWFSYGNN